MYKMDNADELSLQAFFDRQNNSKLSKIPQGFGFEKITIKLPQVKGEIRKNTH